MTEIFEEWACHFCQKPGHFKNDCRKFLASQKFDAEVFEGRWIVDSGATCHMCNDESQFIELKQLETIQEVRLGSPTVS